MSTMCCLRTSAVKMRVDDPSFAADLAATHAAVAGKSIAFIEFLIAARGEPYWDGKRLVGAEEVAAAQARYLKGLNPDRGRALLRRFYDGVMGDDHNVVISYVSPLYRADSKIGTATRVGRKTGKVNDVAAGKSLCRELMAAGVFPVVADDLPPGGFFKAAWIAAFSAVRSWNEVNALYVRKTGEMREKLAALESRWASADPATRAEWGEFVAAMGRSGRRVDAAFGRRWGRIRRALLDGHGARQGEPEFFEPFRALWEDRDHLGVALRAEVLRRELADRPETARFPSLRPESIPLLTCLSRTNTIPIALSSHRGHVVGEIELIRADAPAEKSRHRFRCVPSRYFAGLELATVEKGSTKVAVAGYCKGNKDRVPVSAEIKEPRIRRRGDSWYLDLVQNVEVACRPGAIADHRERRRQVGYFFVPKSEAKPGDISPGLRVLSIDLGLNPALAFSAYSLDRGRRGDEAFEVPWIGWANEEASGKLGGIRDRGYFDRVRRFRQRLRSLRSAIRFRSRLLNGFDLGDAHPRYLDGVLAAFAAIGLPYESDPAVLKPAILDLMGELRREYRSLRDDAARRIGLATEHFEWAGAIGDYIRMLKTWNHGGPKGRVEPSGSIEGECGQYYRYAAAVRKDVIRKVAAEVRKLCVEHRADVVLVEDLEHFRMSVEFEKGMNSLLSLWSPQSILRWIGDAVEPHGAAVVRIDPRHSSRIDPRTGRFGFRDFRGAKDGLVVERDGRVVLIDSDVAATRNLQRRFWGRCAEVWQLECYRSEAGWVPIVGEKAGRYLKGRYGSAHGLIVDGRFVPTTKARHARATAAAGGSGADADDREGDADTVKFYRHGDEWVPAPEHRARTADLFHRLADQASLSVAEKDYVERVKFAADRRLRRAAGKGGA